MTVVESSVARGVNVLQSKFTTRRRGYSQAWELSSPLASSWRRKGWKGKDKSGCEKGGSERGCGGQWADLVHISTSYKSGNVTSVGWQVTLCDPIWHVSSRSGVAALRTAIHLLLTYLLIAHSCAPWAIVPWFMLRHSLSP